MRSRNQEYESPILDILDTSRSKLSVHRKITTHAFRILIAVFRLSLWDLTTLICYELCSLDVSISRGSRKVAWELLGWLKENRWAIGLRPVPAKMRGQWSFHFHSKFHWLHHEPLLKAMNRKGQEAFGSFAAQRRSPICLWHLMTYYLRKTCNLFTSQTLHLLGKALR